MSINPLTAGTDYIGGFNFLLAYLIPDFKDEA